MYPCVIRKLIFIYVLLHLALLTSAETAYYVSDTKTTWEVARSRCSLATPDIIYSDTGITAAINLSGLGVANGEQLWLGYFMAYQLFEYIGCVKLATIQSLSFANFTTIPDPGQCYSACGNNRTIGMTFMTEATIGCFCLERPLISTIDRENGCDKNCIKNVEGPACGGDRFVSVYKIVLGLSVNDIQAYPNAAFKGNCVHYEPKQLYHWNTCDRTNEIICNTGTEAISPSVDAIGSWLFSSAYCFRNQLYPVTNEIIRTVDTLNPQPTGATWTAMFRSIFIGKNNDAGTPLQHGYLEVNSDIGNVAFRQADTTATYKSLCLQESTQSTSTHTSLATTTQTSTNMAETTSGKDTEDDIKTTQQTTQPTSTSPKNTTHTSTNVAETTSDNGSGDDTKHSQQTTPDKDTDNDSKNNSQLYVGVSCGILLLTLVAIIVVVVVVRRRRRKEIKRRQRGNDVNGSDIGTKNDVNVVYQNQPQIIEEPRSTKDGSHVVYLNQLHTFKDDGKNDYIHPIDDMYDECKEADMKSNINVQPEHDDENEYFYPEQGPYEDLKQSDSKTYSQLQTDTTKDYVDDSEYLYPAQGPYEDLKLSDSSTYSQLQTNEQPTNVTHT